MKPRPVSPDAPATMDAGSAHALADSKPTPSAIPLPEPVAAVDRHAPVDSKTNPPPRMIPISERKNVSGETPSNFDEHVVSASGWSTAKPPIESSKVQVPPRPAAATKEADDADRPQNSFEPRPATETGSRPAKQDQTENLRRCREIVDRALEFYEKHDKFTVRVTRREKVGQKTLPEEIMMMHFRKEPRSVYYEWIDEGNAGRSCVYVEGKNEGKVVTRGGRGDLFLTGRTVSFDPEGFFARNRSRYSIRESGLDNMVGKLEDKVAHFERGDRSLGTVRYAGKEKLPDIDRALHHIIHEIPLKADQAFPKGGVRHWHFDVETGQLVQMSATDPSGGFIERFRFERFIPNPSLTDEDFSPSHLKPSRKEEAQASETESAGNWRSASRNETLPK